jgi:hypothetical protein
MAKGEGKKGKAKFTPSSGKAKIVSRARRTLKALKHKLNYFNAHGQPDRMAGMVAHYQAQRTRAAAVGVRLPEVKL